MDHVSARTSKATRCTRCGFVIGFGDRCDWCQHRPTGHVDTPGTYQGRHHSEWVSTVRVLVEEDDVDALRALLPRLAAAATAEARATGQPASAWVDDVLEQLERRQFGTRDRADTRGTDAA